MMETIKAEKLIEDLYYDWYFKNEKGYEDWTDEEIMGSTQRDDIDGFLVEVEKIVCLKLGIKMEEK